VASKLVAAICHGPWTLTEGDLVAGRAVTSWPSLQTDLRNAGVEGGLSRLAGVTLDPVSPADPAIGFDHEDEAVTTPPEPPESSPEQPSPHGDGHAHHQHPHSKLRSAVFAVSMVFGRGKAATCVADLARLTPADHVVDIGCGPGTAVRVASRRCEWSTGVDPDPTMLRFGRWLASLLRRTNVSLVEAGAEAIPLPDASATVVWSLSAVHHWSDRAAGLAEAERVLVPGGRVFLVERLSPPGARGHARYGMTESQLDALERDATRAGFLAVRREMHVAGRDTLAVVRGSTTAA
jgi:SAM-dependent methyltransferase